MLSPTWMAVERMIDDIERFAHFIAATLRGSGYPIEGEELFQRTLITLWKREYDPDRANGRSAEQWVRMNFPYVVKEKAREMCDRGRRERQLTRAEEDARFFEQLAAPIIETQEDFADPAKWDMRQSTNWDAYLEEARQAGKYEWRLGNDEKAEQWAEWAALWHTLTSNEEDARLWILHHLDEIQLNEIALALGVGEATLYKRHSRLLEKIRDRKPIELASFALN